MIDNPYFIAGAILALLSVLVYLGRVYGHHIRIGQKKEGAETSFEGFARLILAGFAAPGGAKLSITSLTMQVLGPFTEGERPYIFFAGAALIWLSGVTLIRTGWVDPK